MQLVGMNKRMKSLAERQGFEPWVPLQVQRISNPSRSTTPAPLQTIQFSLSGCRIIKNSTIVHRVAVANLRCRSTARAYPSGGLFSDHQSGGIGVAAGDGWHDARIDHAQALHAFHTQMRI